MKKNLLLVVLLTSLFLFLTGCGKGNDNASSLEWIGIFNSIEKVDVISSDGTDILTSFSSNKELNTFIDALKMDEWNLAKIPSDATEGKTYKLYQKGTIKLIGLKKSKNKLKEIATITTYEDLPYIKLSVAKISFVFEVPEEVRKYLE